MILKKIPKKKLLKIGVKRGDDDFLLQSTLRQNIGSLEKKFSDFPKYPEPARTALIDIEYNLGRSGFSEKRWPNLYKAVRERDCATAAKESERDIGENDERNERTKEKFFIAQQLAKRNQR